MIEAVIFDMDGVITDTSMIHAAAESSVLAEAGINITPEDIVRTYSGFKDTDTSGDEVKTGKPDPAVFLLTAQKLHILPAKCLVIEDAPHGIKAAKTAGMKCLGITTTHRRTELEGADKIIDEFKELNFKEIQDL